MPGLVVDLDGTVYRGDVLIPGAAGALDRLRAAGYRVVFATNKSIARAKDYTEKLTHLGVSSDEGHIVTVNEVLTQHLVNKFGRNATVLVIGEDPLREELTGAGLAVTGTVRDAHAVALGWDRRFDYQKLDAVFQAGLRGTLVFVTVLKETSLTVLIAPAGWEPMSRTIFDSLLRGERYPAAAMSVILLVIVITLQQVAYRFSRNSLY